MNSIKNIFPDLNKADLEIFNREVKYSDYKKGQIIFHEGREPGGIYFITRGAVKLFTKNIFGKEQIIGMAKEGQLIGYRCLLNDQLYNTTAVALIACQVGFIPRKVFLAVIQKNIALVTRMMKMLAHDVEIAEHQIENLAFKPVRERLAHALLYLADMYGFERDGKTINISITKQELANFIGTAIETVSRLLSELKKEKMIDSKWMKIKILNHKKLKEIATFYD